MILGGCVFLVGTFFFFGGRLPFRLGRLPGDIVLRGENTAVYFPITTSILMSIGLSLVFGVISRFRR